MPSGQTFEEYQIGDLAKDATVEAVISGKPNLTNAKSPVSGGASGALPGAIQMPILMAGGILGVVLTGVGIGWYRRARPDASPVDVSISEFDQLITQIALLDEQRQAGEIAEDDYAPRRAVLMKRARDLMQENDKFGAPDEDRPEG
jgi:hypothetical protein